MNTFIVSALCVALVICVIALVRETRMRRALQRLLKLIFEHWRSHDQNDDSQNPDSTHPDDRGL